MALPNGPMEIVLSFDTTGSMSGCLNEVRGRVSDMVQRLQADIPGIKMALFAHGDYCDSHNYVTKYVDFTDNVVELVDFAQNVKSTGGGDSDECYELVLYEVRTKLSWTPGSQRALVLIGDCNPHEPSYPQNKLKLDWRKEADALGKIGVRIYSVQCHNYGADKFYKDIAKRTDGRYLKLSDFKNVFDLLMSVCYKEKGDDLFNIYEKEVRARSTTINKDLDTLFGDLRDKGPGSSSSDSTTCIKDVKTKSSDRVAKPLKTIKAKKTKAKDPLRLTKTSPANIMKKKLKAKKALPVSAKFLEKNLPKLRRENVPENNFLLREMPWSNWQLVISPSKQETKGITRPRYTMSSGYKVARLNGDLKQIPVLYEVGVQTKQHSRKFVVYSKMFRVPLSGTNWESRLLGKKEIKAQIDNVVEKNCNVYVRRMVIKGEHSKNQVKRAMSRYDYAWKALRSGQRKVSKGNIDISCPMDI